MGAPLAAAPVPVAAPFPVAAPAPLPLAAPIAPVAPVAPSNQFHAQDEFGQFSFGYQNINSAKTETKDAFGVTRGSYQYVDANGVLQTVNYIADDINGFRVAGTNIPVAPVLQLPVPIVHNAPAPVLNHVVQATPAPAPFAAPIPTPNFLPVNQVFAPEQFAFVPAPAPQPILNQAAFAPAPIAAPAPLPLAAPAPLPLAAPVPVAPIVEPPSSQFHAQDEFGQFSFGYQNINSAKTETKDAFGVTRGSYQYVDANGVLQTVNYIADDINGFRVAGTNIPVAPEAAPVVAPVAPIAAPLVAPVAPEETPEVAAARAEHLAAVEKAKADASAADE